MKKRKILFSGLLSIAAFGLFTNVNAESYIVDSLPDTFTTREAGRVSNATDGSFTVDENKDAVLTNVTIASLNGASGNNVIDYHTTTGLKPFCIDRTIEYAPNKQYKKDAEITDYGIIYIIENAENYYLQIPDPDSTVTVNATEDIAKKMELSWMTQIALWQYLDTQGTFVLPSTGINPNITDGTAITGSDNYYYSKRSAVLWAKATELATAAKTTYTYNPADVSTIEFWFDGKYELNKDTKKIKTSLITPKEMSGMFLNSFNSLDLTKAPEGTKIYDENGTVLDSNKFNGPFYLEFPIENVDNYSFDFDVTSTLSGYTYGEGYKYVTTDGNYQPLILVTRTSKNLTGAINFKGSYIEDTASMISRSIYFIGFLILVAGVGMIYVNVKPNESKK